MKKNFLATIALAIPLLLVGAGCSNQTKVSSLNPPTTTTGRVIVSITDDALNMGDIAAVTLVENKIELHSTSTGWVTASTDTRSFNLLELKAKNELALAANANIEAGYYDLMRISVVSVTLTKTDGSTTTAKIPSNQILVKIPVTVTAGATISIKLDILADASIHRTGNGKYIFTPVVKFEFRNRATVKFENDDRIKIESGDIDDESDEGMDENGEMKRDFRFNDEHKFEIDNDDKIRVTSTLKNTLKVNLLDDDNR